MNKFICTAVLTAGLALFGTGAEEAHAGNSSFFISVGGPRASLGYGSGYGSGFRSAFADPYRGGRNYGWDRYSRGPISYGRSAFRPVYNDGYRRDVYRRPCDRGGYFGY